MSPTLLYRVAVRHGLSVARGVHDTTPEGDTMPRELAAAYWLITIAEGGSIPPDASSPVSLGAYRADGEPFTDTPAVFRLLILAMLDVDRSLMFAPPSEEADK